MTSYAWAVDVADRCGAHSALGVECDQIRDHDNYHASRNGDGSIGVWWPCCRNHRCDKPLGHRFQCSVPLVVDDDIQIWKERAYIENERRYAAEYRRDAAEAALAVLRANVGAIKVEMGRLAFFGGEAHWLTDQIDKLASRLHVLVSNEQPQLDHYHRDLYWALRTLVELKDGPRNEEYEERKPKAWQRARDVISVMDAIRDTDRLEDERDGTEEQP